MLPLQYGGKKYNSLVHMFVRDFKSMHTGHNFSVTIADVVRRIKAPLLTLKGRVMDDGAACVCDCVNWGLTEFFIRADDKEALNKVRGHHPRFEDYACDT